MFSLIDLQSTNVNEFTGLVNENENGILTLGGVENGFGPNGQTQSMMLTLSADGRTLQVRTLIQNLKSSEFSRWTPPLNCSIKSNH